MNKTDVVRFLKKKQVVITGVAVVSFAAGAGTSYVVLNKVLSEKYSAIATEEIDAAREAYEARTKLQKEGAYSDPSKAREALEAERAVEEIKEAASGLPLVVEKSEAVKITETYASPGLSPQSMDALSQVAPIETNLYADIEAAMSEWDLETELLQRSPDKPYVLDHAEFFENEHDWDVVTLTYFAEDDILINESDDILDNVDYLVGEINLERFGAGSKDPNVVYVANEGAKVFYEIIKSSGSYGEEVAGLGPKRSG